MWLDPMSNSVLEPTLPGMRLAAVEAGDDYAKNTSSRRRGMTFSGFSARFTTATQLSH